MKKLIYQVNNLEFSTRTEIVYNKTYRTNRSPLSIRLYTFQSKFFYGAVNFIYGTIN